MSPVGQRRREERLEHAKHVEEEAAPVDGTVTELERFAIEQQTGEPDRRSVARVQTRPGNLGYRPAAHPRDDAVERAAKAAERSHRRGIVQHRLDPPEGRLHVARSARAANACRRRRPMTFGS